ncbi:hypothetical protein AB0O20_20555 [Streptomyces kronopolitis]|uniref:hypothetical protein n=1 Tax=Streptomyces kronopolitis TaxID=1612435 RepID=UPI00342538DB
MPTAAPTVREDFEVPAHARVGYVKRPVTGQAPDHPKLYALADQQRDGQGRVTRAVAMLRKAGYQVDVDAAFAPSLAPETVPARDRPPRIETDVAFAEHPQLGIVAATDDRSHALGGRLLEEHGWRHDPSCGPRGTPDPLNMPATPCADATFGGRSASHRV